MGIDGDCLHRSHSNFAQSITGQWKLVDIELKLCLVFYVGPVYCCLSWPGLPCKIDFNLNETNHFE